LLDLGHSTLALSPDVRVDVQQVVQWAEDDHRAGDARWWVGVLRQADLLPGWYEDWWCSSGSGCSTCGWVHWVRRRAGAGHG
jgi:hypothetical protein